METQKIIQYLQTATMASTTIDGHIQRFYQLQGVTLAERRCSFNHYFKDVTSSIKSPEDITKFFDNLYPRNRLEQIFHITLLLHYKQQKQLFDILYNEDSLLIKLVLKNGEFVEDTFKDVDTTQFMEFLSKVSFVVRAKVITRLSKLPGGFQNNKLDGYYYAVKEKYGLYIAKNLLSGCSLETINDELKKHKILFTNNQLTRIYERSNDLLEEYFNHLKKNNHTDFTNFIKIIKMVALTNEDLYWKLLCKYKFDTKLSYKQTIVVLKKYKSQMIKKVKKYLPILNKHAVIATLNAEEFKLFFGQLLSETIDEFDVNDSFNNYSDAVFYLFKYHTKAKRFELLQEVFKEKYNANILDHEEFINELVLELVPIKDRVDMIEKKLKKDPPEDNYVAFYETEKALELLKKKISNTTEATKRVGYVELLIKVCKVNSDMKLWPEVLDYILKRHKNEDNSFYSVVFRSIQEHCNLAKFDQKMWDTINDMMEAFNIRFKTYEYTFQTFEEGYMKFKVKNNISIEEDVSSIMKKVYKDYTWYKFYNDASMMRKCLDIMPTIIPKLFSDKKLTQAVSMYYNTVKNYNRQNKRKRIDIFKYDFIVKHWEDIIAEDKSNNTCIFDDLTFVHSQPELIKKITKLIWEGKRSETYQWRWFLKYQPQVIVQNYEKFFEENRHDTGLRKFYYNVTYFSHLGIPELFYKKSCELLQTKDLPGESHQYVAAVKFLVHHKNFIEIVDPLLPKESSIIDPKNEKNYTEVRQTIARVIGLYKEKSKSLDTLAIIARGDYLQFALFAMHKIMYHTPEYKLKEFLAKIADGSVSLRKHVIFILAGMSTVQNIYETFKKIGETEKNPSVRTYLLRTTIQCFQLNPIQKFFELTKKHALLIEPENVEGYSLLIELKKIPMEFITSYVEFVWEYIMESTDKDVLELRYNLLNNIDKTIMEQVNDDLLHKIVVRCLDFEKDDLQRVNEFAYQYIIDRDIKDVGNRIKVVVGQFPKPGELKNAKASKNVNEFIIAFCKAIIKKKHAKNTEPVNVNLILTEFAQLSLKTASFKPTVWLNLTKMYLTTENHKMFIENFGQYYIETVNKLSLFIIHTLAEIFSELASIITEAEKLKFQEIILDFLVQFLDNESRVQKELFVVLVLPENASKSENVLKKQSEIMKMLNESQSDVVKTAISCYLDSIF